MALYWRGLSPAPMGVVCRVFRSRTTDGDSSGLCSRHLLQGDLCILVCFVFVRGALRASEIIISQSVSYTGQRDPQGRKLSLPRPFANKGSTVFRANSTCIFLFLNAVFAPTMFFRFFDEDVFHSKSNFKNVANSTAVFNETSNFTFRLINRAISRWPCGLVV